jgi:hypothetical protein
MELVMMRGIGGTIDMRGDTDRAQTQQLLIEWYDWSKKLRMRLGYMPVSCGCLESPSSRQWDSTQEIVDELYQHETMEAIDWCVNELPSPMQNAIGVEMRNLEVGRQVRRPVMGGNYHDAISQIIPLMHKKCLITS